MQVRAAMLLEDLRLGDYLKIRNVKIFQSGKLTNRPKTCEINSLLAGPTSDSLLHVLDTATNTHFLVDTGAEVSLVPPTEPELEKTPSLSLIAANGSPIKSYGTRRMDLLISKNRYTWHFQVAAVHKSILGADFLWSNGLLPDLRNRRLISLKDLGLIYGVFKHVPDRYKLKNIVYQATATNEFASLLKDRPELTTPTFSLALTGGKTRTKTLDWSKDMTKAFEATKEALADATLLHQGSPNRIDNRCL